MDDNSSRLLISSSSLLHSCFPLCCPVVVRGDLSPIPGIPWVRGKADRINGVELDYLRMDTYQILSVGYFCDAAECGLEQSDPQHANLTIRGLQACHFHDRDKTEEVEEG